MTDEQRDAAVRWLDEAFAQLQDAQFFLQQASIWPGDQTHLHVQKSFNAVQHAIERIAAVRILLVAGEVTDDR